MNEARKTVRNISASLPLHILQILFNFAVRTVFIRMLAEGFLGVDGVLGDVLTLLSISECGLNTAMMYMLYAPLEQGDSRKISAICQYAGKLFNGIAAGVMLSALALMPLILGSMKEVSLPASSLALYYILKISTVSITYLSASRSALISADEKDYIVRTCYAFTNIVRDLIQIACLFLFRSYLLYLLADVGMNLIYNLLIVRKCRQLYPALEKGVFLEPAEKRAFFSNTKDTFCYKLSTLALNATDMLLVSILISTITAGKYSLYATLYTSLVGILNLFFTGVVHSIGHFNVQQSADRQKEAFSLLQGLMFILAGTAAICFFLLADDFVSLWGGSEKVLGMEVCAAISLNLFISVLFFPVDIFRQTTGLFKKTKWMALLCALVNIVLSILLSRPFGLCGILFATPLSRILTTFWFEPMLLFRDHFRLERKAGVDYFNTLLAQAFSLVICAFVCQALCFWCPGGWKGFALKAVIVFASALAGMLSVSCYLNPLQK